MNTPYFEERVDPLEIVEESNKDTHNLVEKADSFDDSVSEQAAPVLETPVDGPLANEVAKYEAPVQGFPKDETVHYKTPVSETIAGESDVRESIPYKTPVGETITHEAPTGTIAGSPAALLSSVDAEHFRTRWNEIQGKFVDEPRAAVQQADVLVSEVIEQIAQSSLEDGAFFNAERPRQDAPSEKIESAIVRLAMIDVR